MPRAEFATYATGTSTAPTVPPPAAAAPRARPIAASKPNLRILLVDDDAARAGGLRALLQGIFGEGLVSDWVTDGAQAAELLAADGYDVCLCADGRGATAVGLAGADSGSATPIIVLGRSDDAEADLATLDAGAADYIPRAELTAPALERSIRRALLRHDQFAAARREIDGLTTEKTRLNLLRDANHRFVENACHDFRSPLTVIKEFASIISEGLAGDVNEEQAEFLEIILTRVDQLSQMVDAILDASRLESDLIGVRREEHALVTLIEKVRPTLEQRAVAHKVAIEFSIAAGLPSVFADAESVGRVIVNLGANACKFAGENGKIQVWAHYDEDKREVVIGVTDSGPGIAPEHVKLIFDRFQQVPDDQQREKGFGLGLHIASELVRVNFGTLSVESEPNKGSTFAFTLPIFDVNLLIPLHFDFLKTLRHTFQQVAIAVASAMTSPDNPTLGEVERVLNRQLRSYDLLLRLSPGTWLVCVACDAGEAGQVAERLVESYSKSNRSRSDGPLPDLRFRPVGTWALASRPEGLRDVIRSVSAAGGGAAGRP